MKTLFSALVAAVVLPAALHAQPMGDASQKIGNMSREDFNKKNQKGNEEVAAIKPTKDRLSEADQRLLMLIAAGGQKQLAMSQAAVGKVVRDDVKTLAQSEVEEQTGIAAKLQEIAMAKGVTLPAGPDEAARMAMDKMNGMEGPELERAYVKTSGVEGHIDLEKTMEMVKKRTADPALKDLAKATLPVIMMHKKVSMEILYGMPISSASMLEQR